MKAVIYTFLLLCLFNYCSMMEFNRNIHGYFLFKEPYKDNCLCIILLLLTLGWIITDIVTSKRLKLIIATMVLIFIVTMIITMIY